MRVKCAAKLKQWNSPCAAPAILFDGQSWWCKRHSHGRTDAMKSRELWATRGPELLRAAEVFAAGSRPCSHPIGMAGSPARQSWEDQCFAFGVLMREIAACEEIEGVTKRC